MNIAFVTVYGEKYISDRLFDSGACEIGQNLLLPNILLKSELERQGHQCHTADLFSSDEIDVYIFQDIPRDSLLTAKTLRQFGAYFYHKKWITDYLRNAYNARKKTVLQINEPPSVMPLSHEKKYHNYFDKIITWDDDLAACNSQKYVNIKIPQPKPRELVKVSFSNKKNIVIMAGNKKSKHINGLYNSRREIIDFLNTNCDDFDLYGPGWDKEGLSCYRGFVTDKLSTLSKYKFCVCYENIRDLNGYITEKIFDCFFSGCVPIYMGAKNIKDYIPEGAFIDATRFKSPRELYDYIISVDEKRYNMYLDSAMQFINSDKFESVFSVESYVKKMLDVIHSI